MAAVCEVCLDLYGPSFTCIGKSASGPTTSMQEPKSLFFFGAYGMWVQSFRLLAIDFGKFFTKLVEPKRIAVLP